MNASVAEHAQLEDQEALKAYIRDFHPADNNAIWQDSHLMMPIVLRHVQPLTESGGRFGHERVSTAAASGSKPDDAPGYEIPDYRHSPKVRWHQAAAAQPPILPFVSTGGGGSVAAVGSVDHRAVRAVLPPPMFQLGPMPALKQHHAADLDVPFESPPLDQIYLHHGEDSNIAGLDQPGCVCSNFNLCDGTFNMCRIAHELTRPAPPGVSIAAYCCLCRSPWFCHCGILLLVSRSVLWGC